MPWGRSMAEEWNRYVGYAGALKKKKSWFVSTCWGSTTLTEPASRHDGFSASCQRWLRRCEDEKMRRWEDVKIRRCEVRRCEDEKMWRWEGVNMRRCEDEKVWRWEDVKMRRCEDEKMWRWEGVKMRRCEDEKVWSWEGVKMRRCEDEKVWRWEDVKMRRCEDEKMWRWEGVKLRRCEDEKMWRWEGVKMRRCEDEKVWRWEGAKMRRCEDEKMRYRPPLLEEPCAQTLSGMNQKYKNWKTGEWKHKRCDLQVPWTLWHLGPSKLCNGKLGSTPATGGPLRCRMILRAPQKTGHLAKKFAHCTSTSRNFKTHYTSLHCLLDNLLIVWSRFMKQSVLSCTGAAVAWFLVLSVNLKSAKAATPVEAVENEEEPDLAQS